MQSLRDVLVQQGLGSALTGWVLNDASAISADGRTIVGTGTVSGHTEGWIARLPEPDTDGDGLLDDWETNGIPYTDHNSQPQRYILDVDSDNVSDAHAMRKDLFIEVDAMDTLNFDPSLFTMIEAAFAVAPISNPDLTNGIELHVVLDDLDLPFSRETPSPGGAFPPDFETLKLTANAGSQFVIPGYFGSATERALPDAAGRREARLKAFRYAIFINKMTPNSNGHRLAGQANGVPGNGMVACAGLSMFDDNHNDTEELAGTIMHEFGHLLGLSHGGLLDGTNGKPNYVSVMNYLLNRRSSWSDTLWTLDYSRAELPTLNETQLDEVQGIPSGGEYDHVQMPFGTSVLDPEGNEIRRVQYVQLDGSPVDFGAVGSVFPDGQFTSGAWQDLNYHGSEFPISGANLGQVLTGTDDWDVLSYPVPITTDSRFALAGPSEDEITEELMLAIEGMPLPLGVCPADATGDHAVNIDDLLAVISDWGPCAAWPTACNGDVAPVVGNQVVNIADLLAVIAHWGPCP
jgi:hypothetical protein